MRKLVFHFFVQKNRIIWTSVTRLVKCLLKRLQLFHIQIFSQTILIIKNAAHIGIYYTRIYKFSSYIYMSRFIYVGFIKYIFIMFLVQPEKPLPQQFQPLGIFISLIVHFHRKNHILCCSIMKLYYIIFIFYFSIFI